MIPLTEDTHRILADLDQRNRAAHADLLLRERIRGLIADYLRPAGTGLPEPTATIIPPDLAVGPTLARPPAGRRPASCDRRAAG